MADVPPHPHLPDAAPPAERPGGLARIAATATDVATRALELPPVHRGRAVLDVYNGALCGLMAAGLAFGALFAGLTGLLFAVGVLGYLVTDGAVRESLVQGFIGQLAPFAPIARDGLVAVAAHAGAISLIGLVGMAWAASGFYGSLDAAFGRVFSKAPPRGTPRRVLRGLVSVLVLLGGLLSGVVVAGVQARANAEIPGGATGDLARLASAVGFPLLTAVLVTGAVAFLYRVVPNLRVPLAVLRAPALLAGLALTALTELFVVITPQLVGSLAVFGSFAAVFAALVWLSLAFQVLLMGASWTRLRLDDAEGRTTPTPVPTGRP